MNGNYLLNDIKNYIDSLNILYDLKNEDFKLKSELNNKLHISIDCSQKANAHLVLDSELNCNLTYMLIHDQRINQSNILRLDYEIDELKIKSVNQYAAFMEFAKTLLFTFYAFIIKDRDDLYQYIKKIMSNHFELKILDLIRKLT